MWPDTPETNLPISPSPQGLLFECSWCSSSWSAVITHCSHLSHAKTSDNRTPEGRGKLACSLQSKKAKQRTQPFKKISRFKKDLLILVGGVAWNLALTVLTVIRRRSQSGLSLQFLRGSSLLGYAWAAKFSVWVLNTVTSLDPESKMEKSGIHFFKTLLSVAPLQRTRGENYWW